MILCNLRTQQCVGYVSVYVSNSQRPLARVAFCSFYPRDTCQRGLCYRKMAGWLDCCLSVTRRYCVEPAKSSLKLFRLSGSLVILVYLTPSAETQFQGEPLSGVEKYTGVGKFCDFRLRLPFISETVRDPIIYLTSPRAGLSASAEFVVLISYARASFFVFFFIKNGRRRGLAIG